MVRTELGEYFLSFILVERQDLLSSRIEKYILDWYPADRFPWCIRDKTRDEEGVSLCQIYPVLKVR
jgi:hypothetical protein